MCSELQCLIIDAFYQANEMFPIDGSAADKVVRFFFCFFFSILNSPEIVSFSGSCGVATNFVYAWNHLKKETLQQRPQWDNAAWNANASLHCLFFCERTSRLTLLHRLRLLGQFLGLDSDLIHWRSSDSHCNSLKSIYLKSKQCETKRQFVANGCINCHENNRFYFCFDFHMSNERTQIN